MCVCVILFENAHYSNNMKGKDVSNDDERVRERKEKYILWYAMSLSLSFVYILQGCALNAICVFMMMTMMTMMTMMILIRVTLRARIANRLVTDSRLRGGIVNIPIGRSCVLFVRPLRPKALWRFRVSTSNSPSGLPWPHTNTLLHRICRIFSQRDIRVCEDDRVNLLLRQYANPKALWLVRVSIWDTQAHRLWQRMHTSPHS